MQIANLIPQLSLKKEKSFKIKEFVQLYREPISTFCIVPNNSPNMNNYTKRRNRRETSFDFEDEIYNDSVKSTLLLNTISGLFSKFYLPERIRFSKNGVKVKMNDIVSFKTVIMNGEMKFYLTVPEKWSDSFLSTIKREWGQVDIIKVEDKIVDFNPNRAKAMEIHMRHHYGLAIKNNKNKNDDDSFCSSIASVASILGEDDKILIDYNIQPVSDSWKENANKKLKKFKNGNIPSRDDGTTLLGFMNQLYDLFNVILDEFNIMIRQIMNQEEGKEERKEQLFDLKYSDSKTHANTKGFSLQTRVIGESKDDKKIKLAFKNIENSFELLNGDNKFVATYVKTKRGIKTIIESVEQNKPLLNKPKDILFEKEMENLVKIPNKQTLKEFEKVIKQDNFTRIEINNDFFNDENEAIPFARTLDKDKNKIYFSGYHRESWTPKGRYVKEKTKLDDRSTATMVFGSQGSGKTSLSENQALYTFGCHFQSREEWKEKSKSVIVFDVADGGMINNIYKRVPEFIKDRVVILNHSNYSNPIAVNNADLAEFNMEVMQDEDYAYTLAEMEAKLVLEILESDKSISMDRWFISALQCVHTINPDWGYIEAMRTLIDDVFRQTEVIPKLEDRRMRLEIQSYNDLAMSGKAMRIIQTIENRFSQLERDQKLWDCIAQKPLRDEDGKVKLNFRKMMDGDEDGAYLILVHIPKSGVSKLYRKFIFAHYFTKIWNVALSREVGFKGREYRPESLVIMDEIHQIIDIPIVARLFIDIFKEPRKYSKRYLFTLHGWSSFAKAGRGLENDIKQSIMDNGCNLIMLKGGEDAFQSLTGFLNPMSIADFNNLMNMDFCGIFRISWQNKNHVFQAKLLEHVEKNKDFKKFREFDSEMLHRYVSEYGRDKKEVRDENLDRSYSMLENSIKNLNGDDEAWENIENLGMKENLKNKEE